MRDSRRQLPITREIINRAKISVPPQSSIFSQSKIFRDSNENNVTKIDILIVTPYSLTFFLGQTWSVKKLKLVFRIIEEIFWFVEVKSLFFVKIGLSLTCNGDWKFEIHLVLQYKYSRLLKTHAPDRFTPHAPVAQNNADQRWLIAYLLKNRYLFYVKCCD